MKLAFDIEANGLYNEASLIHCLVLKDIDTGEVDRYRPDTIEEGLRKLLLADLMIGHNVISYDLAVIQKLYPWFDHDWTKVRDTLNLSRLIWPNLSDLDNQRSIKVQQELTLKRRRGSHALEAWGIRLGFNKLDYQGGWEEFSEEMLEYCVVDVEVTDRLWKLIEEEDVDPRASELEHGVQVIISRQERYGFPFDEAKANALTALLLRTKASLEAKLQDTFKPFWMADGKPKVSKRTMDYKTLTSIKGARQWGTFENGVYQPIKLTVFNPGSTHHIVNRLQALYKWKPTEFTDKGTPKCDDAVLGKLPWPEAKLLAEYFMVQKRLALVSEGDKAFTKSLRNGRVYGELIVNGAVTGRGTHKIIANIPRVTTQYGKEMRELFTASPGRVQVGIDVSGLELRMLAHFLAKNDGGAYGKIVCEGDVHTANQQAAGLETRDQAKTFIYAFLYGGGDVKIGSIAKPMANETVQRQLGKKLKAAFITKTPGLEKMIDTVKHSIKGEAKVKNKTTGKLEWKQVRPAGYLVGLDGRKIWIRSDHAALNFLLQGGGSLVCKRWMIEVDKAIEAEGWRSKVQQLIWYHDELQFDVDPNIADEFGMLAVECIGRAASYFGVRVPLTGEYKVGKNWKECH